jgi:putative membrane protein
MMAPLNEAYPWVKALHIIAAISWLVALLYLPRLYVYHCSARAGSEAAEMLKLMERRLLRAIMTPAMIATLITGAFLLYTPGAVSWDAAWVYLKLASVGGLLLFHGLLARWRREFKAGANQRPARFYKIANEVPTLLMIVIVIMVVVRPF